MDFRVNSWFSAVDRYSKIAERWVEPCPDKRQKPHIFHSQNQENLSTVYTCIKAPWMSKGEGVSPHSKWCQHTIDLLLESMLAKNACSQTRKDTEIYQIQIQNQAKQDDWPKETWNTCPIKKWFRATTQVQPSQSPPVSIHKYCSLFFFFLFSPSNGTLVPFDYLPSWWEIFLQRQSG